MNAPAIGEQWPEQGGIYAGIIRDSATAKQWHLLMAEQAFSGKWGAYGIEIPSEFSLTDGLHNTMLISSVEPDNGLIKSITEHSSGSHSDFYLPAQKELNLLYINLQDRCEQDWHWSSTHFSARYAWLQNFEVGYQGLNYEDLKLAARAVRRLPIE